MSSWVNGKSSDSINIGYDPISDSSDTGFKRPPSVAGCLLDYFKAIGGVEDGGEFAHSEANDLIENPGEFFQDLPR